jgi:hypothetical protein
MHSFLIEVSSKQLGYEVGYFVKGMEAVAGESVFQAFAITAYQAKIITTRKEMIDHIRTNFPTVKIKEL